MIRIPYPVIRGQTTREQLEEIRRYLYRLAELINMALEEDENDGKI